MKDNRILVIGGSGFLGQSIVTSFKQNGYNVVIGDVEKPKYGDNLSFINVDLLNYENVSGALNDFDVIINCAGQITNPINTCLQLNTQGITNLVNVLSKGTSKKLIHISTVSVYGACEFANEESSLNPETPYASIKAFAEFIIHSRLKDNYTILRIPNLYGPNQTKGIFSYLLKSAKGDKRLVFNNDGKLIRNYLHVNDCAKAVLVTFEKNLEGIFNVPSIEKKSIIELIELFEYAYKIKLSSTFDKVASLENINKVSFDKFRSNTDFFPEYTIEKFLKSFD